jgi:hypothetical protein
LRKTVMQECSSNALPKLISWVQGREDITPRRWL